MVDDLHIVRSIVAPHETDAPLFIDPDAMLPAPITGQCLEMIARDAADGGEGRRGMEYRQSAFRLRGEGLELPDALAGEESCRSLVAERLDRR
jgi:hypothetical protein